MTRTGGSAALVLFAVTACSAAGSHGVDNKAAATTPGSASRSTAGGSLATVHIDNVDAGPIEVTAARSPGVQLGCNSWRTLRVDVSRGPVTVMFDSEQQSTCYFGRACPRESGGCWHAQAARPSANSSGCR